MNLMQKLKARATPVKVGLIGAEKFGAMFLAQIPHIPNLEVTAIAGLDPDKVKATLKRVGWDDARLAGEKGVVYIMAYGDQQGISFRDGGLGRAAKRFMASSFLRVNHWKLRLYRLAYPILLRCFDSRLRGSDTAQSANIGAIMQQNLFINHRFM